MNISVPGFVVKQLKKRRMRLPRQVFLVGFW